MAILTVEEALERVLELCAPLPAETVTIAESLGRSPVIAVTATRTLPPWDNSAMDGYAVRSADTKAANVRLAIVEEIFAGQTPTIAIEEGMCARIMTGAQLPPGADAVVMQEGCTVHDAESVEILEACAPGANVRRRGEDCMTGAVLVPAGVSIGLAEAGALWGQSLNQVSVHRRPRVFIASSGDELCNVWDEPNGRIVDTNSPVIAEAVKRCGGLATNLGIAPDRLDAVVDLFAKGLDGDVLITIAGASVGDKDFTREAFLKLGVAMDFWKVAMKPGKPIAVGAKGSTLVIGLPGNPVSALVTFEIFVRPALRRLQGLQASTTLVPARAAAPISKKSRLRHFVRSTVTLRDGELWATPLKSQSSGALSSAIGATHLITIPPESGDVASGDAVQLMPLSWSA
jgi:molybdopterin molybdotransferase